VRKQVKIFISDKYVGAKWREVREEIEKFKLETENVSWSEIKDKIFKLDPFTVGEFWDWANALGHLENLLTDKFGNKTTKAKQKILEDLSKREGLTVYFNELDFYMGKR